MEGASFHNAYIQKGK